MDRARIAGVSSDTFANTRCQNGSGNNDPAQVALAELLAEAGIVIGGQRAWDMVIHDPQTAERILGGGSLGLGESYMDGWWDFPKLDEFIARVLFARLDDKVRTTAMMMQVIRARFFNLQNPRRAWTVGEVHYDLGHDFFESMLDDHLAYTCG